MNFYRIRDETFYVGDMCNIIKCVMHGRPKNVDGSLTSLYIYIYMSCQLDLTVYLSITEEVRKINLNGVHKSKKKCQNKKFCKIVRLFTKKA